jgi:hypothetical protein
MVGIAEELPHQLAFHQWLRGWIKIPLPRSVGLSACCYCNEWVQVTYHGGHVVFGSNWPELVFKYELEYNNVVDGVQDQGVLYQDEDLQEQQLHRRLYTYPNHN